MIYIIDPLCSEDANKNMRMRDVEDCKYLLPWKQHSNSRIRLVTHNFNLWSGKLSQSMPSLFIFASPRRLISLPFFLMSERQHWKDHYDDVIMTMLASQITSLTVVYSIVYSGVNQRKHQSSASLAFVREIHRGPVNFPHKWPVTRKMFPFDDVIMYRLLIYRYSKMLKCT